MLYVNVAIHNMTNASMVSEEVADCGVGFSMCFTYFMFHLLHGWIKENYELATSYQLQIYK